MVNQEVQRRCVVHLFKFNLWFVWTHMPTQACVMHDMASVASPSPISCTLMHLYLQSESQEGRLWDSFQRTLQELRGSNQIASDLLDIRTWNPNNRFLHIIFLFIVRRLLSILLKKASIQQCRECVNFSPSVLSFEVRSERWTRKKGSRKACHWV
jgi:hypothetical protein